MVKSIPRSNKKQCKIRVRKSDAKLIGKYPKSMPKGEPKTTRRQGNADSEMSRKNDKKPTPAASTKRRTKWVGN